MKKRGRFEARKVKKPVGAVKVLLIVLAVILALILIAGIAGVVYYNYMLSKLDQVVVPTIVYTEESTEPVEQTTLSTEALETTVVTEPEHIPSSADYINFLVVGQAARAGQGTDSERMADTVILFTLNTHEKTLTMTSILRDSFVKMADYMGHYGGRIKLTTVYHLGSHYEGSPAGSMELMNLTLYKNFGIEVDHNIEVSFDAFMDVINAIGGIEIELTQAEADYMNKDDRWVRKDVTVGVNKLDGMSALCYARMRKAEGDNDSDIVRTERQRKFVTAVLAKMKTLSISELQKLAEKLLPMITTSMSNDQITDALLKLLPMLPELTIEKGGVCPADGWGDQVDIYGDGVYHSVMKFDEAKTKKQMRAITEGEK